MTRLLSRWLLVLPLAFAIYACSESRFASPAAPSGGTTFGDTALAANQGGGESASSAVITFGRPDTGSPFPPPDQHDQSAHAADNLTPRTVVIDAGGSVTFEVPPNVHQLGIYFPGKEPKDVNLSAVTAAPAPCPPVPLIDDTNQRMTAQFRPCFQPWTYTQTFDQPGRYLVICAFIPHFEVGMYGWVIVRERRG